MSKADMCIIIGNYGSYVLKCGELPVNTIKTDTVLFLIILIISMLSKTKVTPHELKITKSGHEPLAG